MNQRLSSTMSEGISPPAVYTLAHNFSIPIFNGDYGMRPPSGAYSVSLSKILQAFKDVLNSYDQTIQNKKYLQHPPTIDEPQLLQAQEILLRAIDEHFDDCEKILKCFFPKGAPFNDNQAVKTFRGCIESYKDHVRKIVNHLKHDQGRLQSIVFFRDNVEIVGYFIEGVDDKGRVGPWLEVHPQNTAFSYARDLRLHLCNLYAVSTCLSDAIKALDPNCSAPTTPQTAFDVSLIDTATKISSLPTHVYPDEVLLDFPEVSVNQNGKDDWVLDLSYPGDISKVGTLKPANVLIQYRGDGVTTDYRMPYSNSKPFVKK